MTRSDSERIAALETQMRILIEQRCDDALQIRELLAIMNQAKGAKWAILGVVGLTSSVTALLVQWGFKGA